jgi:hypothetical protein
MTRVIPEVRSEKLFPYLIKADDFEQAWVVYYQIRGFLERQSSGFFTKLLYLCFWLRDLVDKDRFPTRRMETVQIIKFIREYSWSFSGVGHEDAAFILNNCLAWLTKPHIMALQEWKIKLKTKQRFTRLSRN